MVDLSVNFSDTNDERDILTAKLNDIIKNFALKIPSDIFDLTAPVPDFSVLYRALINSSDDILNTVEDCLGPECFEKRADKVLEERLTELQDKLASRDFYLYRQCLLTAFAGMAFNINTPLKNKIALYLKINTKLSAEKAKALLSLLLEFIKGPIKNSGVISDVPLPAAAKKPESAVHAEEKAENDEIIMSKIRNLLCEAAEKAKAANLVPADKNSTLKTYVSPTPEAQPAKAPLEKEPDANEKDLLNNPSVEAETNSAADGQLSLKDLARRAAKLQTEFRNERLKLAQAGKLPNPAKLPHDFPPKLNNKRQRNALNSESLSSPLELLQERHQSRQQEPSPFVPTSAAPDINRSEKTNPSELPDLQTKVKAEENPSYPKTGKDKDNGADEDITLPDGHERFIAAFDDDIKERKQPVFKEQNTDDFKPVTFYHDVKVHKTQPKKVKTAKTVPVRQDKKDSWFKRLCNFLFRRKDETVLLPYTLEKHQQTLSFIDADTLPQALRARILKERDLHEFRHFLSEQMLNANLPQSLKNLTDAFLKSFFDLQQNPELEEDFITFIKAPLSADLECSLRLNDLLFGLLFLEAQRQGYDGTYLFVGHPALKARHERACADGTYDLPSPDRLKTATELLTSLLSEIYRLQNYSLNSDGQLAALLTENPWSGTESALQIEIAENIMGQAVKLKSFVPYANNQGFLLKCYDDGRTFRLNIICSNLPLLKKAQNLKDKLLPAFAYLGYDNPQINIRLGSNLKVFLNKHPLFKDGLICLRDAAAADPVLRHALNPEQCELIECLLRLLKDLNLCHCDPLGTMSNQDPLNLKLRPLSAMRHLILRLSEN